MRRDVELMHEDEPAIEVMLYTYEMFTQERNVAQIMLSVSSAFFVAALSLLLFAIATERDTTAIIVLTSIFMALTFLLSVYSICQIARLNVGTSYIMTDIIKYVREEVNNESCRKYE